MSAPFHVRAVQSFQREGVHGSLDAQRSGQKVRVAACIHLYVALCAAICFLPPKIIKQDKTPKDPRNCVEPRLAVAFSPRGSLQGEVFIRPMVAGVSQGGSLKL